jgi:hypothetical protein
MPYTNEQWEYFSDWTNYSKEKDLKYSEQEFDYFLQRLKNNQHFSLVRFGEGESRIILKEQKLDRPELSFDPSTESNNFYVKDLEEAAKIDHSNYFVGIQSYTYKPAEKGRPNNEFTKQREQVVKLGNLPRERYTCSRIFCNFYQRCKTDLLSQLMNREIYLVCSQDATTSNLRLNIKKTWKISRRDAWKYDAAIYEDINQKMMNVKDCVLLCCAGFFGNIAISKMSFDNNFNINVGSIFDPLLLNRSTRPYQRGIM